MLKSRNDKRKIKKEKVCLNIKTLLAKSKKDFIPLILFLLLVVSELFLNIINSQSIANSDNLKDDEGSNI